MRSRKEIEEEKIEEIPELKDVDNKFELTEELLLDIRDLLEELLNQLGGISGGLQEVKQAILYPDDAKYG